MTYNPIICAIDTTDMAKAAKLAASLHGHVGAIKLGLEFFTANGAAGVIELAEQVDSDKQAPVFLDLKFHDIPNTVAGAIRATARVNAFMMTVHAAGGKAMMQAAKEALENIQITTKRQRPQIVGVTMLTSLDQNDLESIGIRDNVSDQVKRLAELAQTSGLDGVVCSPHEIAVLRKQCGPNFTLVVPGIRPAVSPKSDQKRIMTPREALEKGADYLVIGRPITESFDPARAAAEILASLSSTAR